MSAPIFGLLENRLFVGVVNTDSELPGSLTRPHWEDNPEQAAVANVSGDQHPDLKLFRAADRVTWSDGIQRVETAISYSYKDLFHLIFQVIDQPEKRSCGPSAALHEA